MRFAAESIHSQPARRYTITTDQVRPTSKTIGRKGDVGGTSPRCFQVRLCKRRSPPGLALLRKRRPRALRSAATPKPGRPSRSSVRIATIAYKDQGVPAKVALEVAESLPSMFRGKGELVTLCQSLSKKWGKSRSTVPLSAFAQAKSTLWSSLQRFVPWLERCDFADDFLWELRHERTLKFRK